MKKPSIKDQGGLFGGVLPPLSGPGAAEDAAGLAAGLAQTKVEKHDYKYNIGGQQKILKTKKVSSIYLFFQI